MRVQTSQGSYFINWHHQPINGVNKSVAYVSQCIVKDKNMKRLKSGLAWCSVRDNFCREKGRKVSLGRAIRIFSKEIRKEIWEAYLNRKVFNESRT